MDAAVEENPDRARKREAAVRDAGWALANDLKVAILIALRERGELARPALIEAVGRAHIHPALGPLVMTGFLRRRGVGHSAYYSLSPKAAALVDVLLKWEARYG